jgi:hypothetical protein
VGKRTGRKRPIADVHSAIYGIAMRNIGLEFLLFGVAPVSVAVLCGIGLVGDITDAEEFVPMYLLGLIFAVAAIVMYGVATLFRTVCWLMTNFTKLSCDHSESVRQGRHADTRA